jgi:hypothetical protein
MRHLRLWIALALLFAAVAVPAIIFFARPPVLVVTDVPFVALYGTKRLKRQQLVTSLTMFRQVKPVLIADGASPDILIFAITEASSHPLCVLFPRSQAQAAQRYHEQFPEILTVLFSGVASLSGLPSPDGILCVYSTDRETDLYRAGIFAGVLATGVGTGNSELGKVDEEAAQKLDTSRTYAFWQDRYVQSAGRDLFLRGVKEEDPESDVVFASYAAQMPDVNKTSCAIITSAGAEYFADNPKMPIILFSWMDPAFAAREVIIIFDDSHWAMVVPAVQMAIGGQESGKIPSNPLILPERISEKNIVQILKKIANKMP